MPVMDILYRHIHERSAYDTTDNVIRYVLVEQGARRAYSDHR